MNNERLTPHQLWREQMIWKLDALTDATRELRDAGELEAVLAHLDAHPSLSAAIAPEPVAWMWQHGETGNTGFVQHASPEELAQWERMNKPRQIVSPLYRAPPVALPALTIPSARAWLDSSGSAASSEWIEGWAACRTFVTSRLAASAAPAPEQMQPNAQDKGHLAASGNSAVCGVNAAEAAREQWREEVMRCVFDYGRARVDVDRSNSAHNNKVCGEAISAIRAALSAVPPTVKE